MLNQPITRLLKRQLRKTIDQDILNDPKFTKFLSAVNDAYLFNESESELYRRAEEIASRDYAMLNEKLKEKNDFLDTFNHGLAHDVKNHTSNILGLVNMLKKYNGQDNKIMVDKITVKMEETAYQLTSIVQGFLYISKTETNIKDDFTDINKEKLIANIENEINFLKYNKDVKINYNFDKIRYIDAIVRIIFVNLISNSIKYGKPKLPVNIDVNLLETNDSIVLEVIDDGIGMDLTKENIKLFNLFNESRDTKGYGVGLFLVKKIVDKNEGTISVSSELEIGTRIKIVFPK